MEFDLNEFLAQTRLLANIDGIYDQCLQQIVDFSRNHFDDQTIELEAEFDSPDQCIRTGRDYVYRLVSRQDQTQICRIPRMTRHGYFVIHGIKKVPLTLELSTNQDVLITDHRDDFGDGPSDDAESMISCRLRFPDMYRFVHVCLSARGILTVSVQTKKRQMHYNLLDVIEAAVPGTDPSLLFRPFAGCDEDFVECVRITLLATSSARRHPAASELNQAFQDALALSVTTVLALIHMSCLCMLATKKLASWRDRDDYVNKHFRTAGETIKVLIISAIRLSCRSYLSYSGRQKQNRTRRRAVADDIFQRVETVVFNTFRTGTIHMFGRSYSKMVIQVSERSSLDRLSSVRRVAVPCDETVQFRAIRQVHLTQIGYICPCETPEDASAGLIKQLATSCLISSSTPVDPRDVLRRCPELKRISDISVSDAVAILSKSQTVVCINGVPQYVSARGVTATLQILRRLKQAYPFVSIVLPSEDHPVISIRTYAGRPLVYVAGAGWIGPGEVIHLEDGTVLSGSRRNVEMPGLVSHRMLGLSASMVPFLQHNHSARNVFATSMLKQALEANASVTSGYGTFEFTTECGQRPLVDTCTGTFLRRQEYDDAPITPNGLNLVVAIMSFFGANQEDAIVINRSCLERGVFRTVRTLRTSYDVSELTADSKGVQDLIRIHREDGIEYRLIGQDPFRSSTYLCTTMSPRAGWNISDAIHGDRVWIGQRRHKNFAIGDKMASRHAQKGVVGFVASSVDLPFTEEGITPDIIINPHSIPGRMTVGQLLESILSVRCANRGIFCDGTPFSFMASKKPEDILNDHLNASLTDGTSGERIRTPVFVGLVYYMPLVHQAEYKVHRRYVGPRTVVSRQPVSGSAQEGGLRIGEMEHDALLAHGAHAVIREIAENSDMTDMQRCSSCGYLLSAGDRCPCQIAEGDADGPRRVPMRLPYSTKVVADVLMSCNIGLRISHPSDPPRTPF